MLIILAAESIEHNQKRHMFETHLYVSKVKTDIPLDAQIVSVHQCTLWSRYRAKYLIYGVFW